MQKDAGLAGKAHPDVVAKPHAMKLQDSWDLLPTKFQREKSYFPVGWSKLKKIFFSFQNRTYINLALEKFDAYTTRFDPVSSF